MSETGGTSYSGLALFGNALALVVPTLPVQWYLGVSTTAPTFAKGSSPYWNFTEPTDTAYARQAVTLVAATTQPTNGYGMVPNGTVVFPTSTVNWGTILYAGLFDSLSAGNLWYFAPLVRSTADGAVTSGSTTVSSATIAFVAGDVGKVVQCPGVPVGTVIASVTSGTAAVMSAEANTTGSGLALAVGTPATVSSADVLSFAAVTALFVAR